MSFYIVTRGDDLGQLIMVDWICPPKIRMAIRQEDLWVDQGVTSDAEAFLEKLKDGTLLELLPFIARDVYGTTGEARLRLARERMVNYFTEAVETHFVYFVWDPQGAPRIVDATIATTLPVPPARVQRRGYWVCEDIQYPNLGGEFNEQAQKVLSKQERIWRRPSDREVSQFIMTGSFLGSGVRPDIPKSASGLFDVAHFDGSANRWTTSLGGVSQELAVRWWDHHTHNGREHASFQDGDYYKISAHQADMYDECAWCGGDIDLGDPPKSRLGERFCCTEHRDASSRALRRLGDSDTAPYNELREVSEGVWQNGNKRICVKKMHGEDARLLFERGIPIKPFVIFMDEEPRAMADSLKEAQDIVSDKSKYDSTLYCFVLKGHSSHKTHLANDEGLPACGAQVDTCALEIETTRSGDLCKRCF